MGRPTKLTEERQEVICRLLRRSVPVEAACKIAGITERTWQTWRKRGRAELERVEEGHRNCRVRKGEEPYVEFFRETTRARMEAEEKLVGAWHKAAENGEWRAAMELLQRKFPERWSKKQKHEHSGTVTHAHEINWEDLTDEQVEALAAGASPEEII